MNAGEIVKGGLKGAMDSMSQVQKVAICGDSNCHLLYLPVLWLQQSEQVVYI